MGTRRVKGEGPGAAEKSVEGAVEKKNGYWHNFVLNE